MSPGIPSRARHSLSSFLIGPLAVDDELASPQPFLEDRRFLAPRVPRLVPLYERKHPGLPDPLQLDLDLGPLERWLIRNLSLPDLQGHENIIGLLNALVVERAPPIHLQLRQS